jgi:hypothetical protein
LNSEFSVGLRPLIGESLYSCNTGAPHSEDGFLSLFNESGGCESLDKAHKILEPWELLLDMGPFATVNYSHLMSILSEFKEMNEKTMAKTILNLAFHHTGSHD